METRPGLARRILFGDFTLWRIVRSVVVVYVVVGALAFFFSERLIFVPPPPAPVPTAGLLMLEPEEGPAIATRYVEVKGARLLVLHSHGNAEDLRHVAPRLRDLSRLGVSVLGYDYPGYGRSGGSPSESGANRAIQAVYRHAVEGLGFAPERIVLYGQSVGSGPTCHLAAARPVGGVVLHAPFVTAFRVMTRWPLFPFDRFRNLSRVREFDVPLLILHGTEDEVIAPWHGRRLHEKAASRDKRIEWIEGARHNDLARVAGPRYHLVLREFLEGIP